MTIFTASRVTMKDFTSGPIGKQIILFSLPIIAGNLLMQLYQFVDSVIVGKFLGKEALAAVGASTPVVFAIVAMVIGLGSGASIVISQYFGRGNFAKVHITSDTLHIVLLVSGVIIGAIGLLLSEDILRATSLPEELIPLGVEYLEVYLTGIFLLFGFNTIAAMLRGVGDSRTPLYFLAFSAILNIILDYTFIVLCGFGVAAAAWATVISQGIAYLAAILYINARKDIVFHINLFKLKFHRGIFIQCLRFGLPTGIQQSFVAFGAVALFGIINSYGTDTIAAFTAGMRIDALAVIPAMNFAMALTSFVGQNIGAGKVDRVKRGLRRTIEFSTITCIVIGIIIYVFGENFLRLFTTDEVVISEGHRYLVIVSLFYPLFSGMYIIGAMLRGAGAVIFPMIATFIALWGCRIPIAKICSKYTNLDGIDIVAGSIVIGWGIGLILMVWYYLSGRWMGKSIFDKK